MKNMRSSIFIRFFFRVAQFKFIFANYGCTITIFHTLFHSKYCIIIQFHIVVANYVKLIYFRRKLRRQQFNQSVFVMWWNALNIQRFATLSQCLTTVCVCICICCVVFCCMKIVSHIHINWCLQWTISKCVCVVPFWMVYCIISVDCLHIVVREMSCKLN